ncbi:MAG: flavodoxin-dependent (E)-4-hydroxy-3-methylbut-2-enyl-diphosphate synthase, partial [Clostridiales bacterium]|nr:flavodoxin-dependent (E)-4-hydroxy-3-methylbut-2-enyl-diphosphate synthase [Clostridiales bacterium]
MTKEIRIGNVTVGGGNTPVIQSMCSTKTADTEATAAQINALASAGCRMVRVAVPDAESAKKLTAIKSKITVPLIADIHFDYRLAILSI